MDVPKIIPINELKNTSKISQACKDSEEPIIITKNGYSDMVLMSVELYEQTMAKMQAAILINEALNNPDRDKEKTISNVNNHASKQECVDTLQDHR